MIQLRPLDSEVPIQAQLAENVSPVVLVNLLRFAPEDEAAVIDAWEHDANWMKKQPGYILTQLHRSVGQSAMFLNYAVWESVAHYRAAFSNHEFHAALAAYGVPGESMRPPHKECPASFSASKPRVRTSWLR